MPITDLVSNFEKKGNYNSQAMNILIKLTCLIGLVIAPILGEGTAIHAESPSEEILISQPSIKSIDSSSMFTKTTSFTFDKKNKAVSSFTFSNVKCQDDNKLCGEILKISGKKEMSFTSASDAVDYSGDLEFKRRVEGILVIGGNEFNSEFLFNLEAINNGFYFKGVLTFDPGSTFKYTSKVSIYVKGKQ